MSAIPRPAACLLTVAMAMAPVAPCARAVSPWPGEFAECRAWTAGLVGPSPATNRPHLVRLFEDAPDDVARGRSWRGTPFRIGPKAYAHGIAFNSTKHLRVVLGRPAARFTADVGLENNDDTQRGASMGNGSVTFQVRVSGREVFATPVMRLADGPAAVDVPLDHATEFEIRVGDGGDGRGWDQGLWGGASVTLDDGTCLRLQDLPWDGAAARTPRAIAFTVAGSAASDPIASWVRSLEPPVTNATAIRHRVGYRDPRSGLEAHVEAEEFRDVPVIEWVGRIVNPTPSNAPVLESIRSLDAALPLPGAGPAVLHWAKGSVASFDDFAPQETPLAAGATLHLQPGGGRSSSHVMPFFALEGIDGGVLAAIGWTGEWAADVTGEGSGIVGLRTGQAQTRISLRPGESIRTPRMMLLFHQGDRWRGQNLLRRHLLAHHRPRRDGRPLIVPIACGNWGGTPAEVHLDNIRRIDEQRLPVEYYWIDAEWYGGGPWAASVGDWAVKTNVYPSGFQPLSRALRTAGRELMLWFEPERVHDGTAWHREHPGWLLGTGGGNHLWNLGDRAAREFLTRFVGDRIDEFGLGCYRQDFNMDPLPFWRGADAPDRQGIAEIRHVEGLYAFWDGLLASRPNLILDNCASGGRRLDLETAGRATPFWRTDGPRDPIAHQCHTWGLLPWWPLSATSQDRVGDDYEFRSSMCSGLCLNWWVHGDSPAGRIRHDFPWDWARKTLAQYLSIRDYYYGDYFPLTPYSQARDVWMAYQLDRPEQGDGLVVALRRPDSPYDRAAFPLRGLDADATYAVTDLDSNETSDVPGRRLADPGLTIGIGSRPGSALFVYRRL